MAGHDDGDGIGAVRGTNRAHRGRRPDDPRDVGVRGGSPRTHVTEGAPDAMLERRPVELDLDRVEHLELTRKVLRQGGGGAGGIATAFNRLTRVPALQRRADGG